MKDLIYLKNTELERYKELLLKKESLIKESRIYENNYIREFGDLINESFKVKLKCIEKKKIISYCQKLINKGIKPNKVDIDKMIEDTMKDYYKTLKELLSATKNAKKGSVISEYQVKQIKDIYYRIAKLIHPDMNPSLQDDEKIKELWERVQIAYRCNNLKDIEELEVLVNNYLKDINYSYKDTHIPNINEKIIKLNEEINKIITSDPYEYKYLLTDVEAIKEKKNILEEEIKDYITYSKKLDKVINSLKIERILS